MFFSFLFQSSRFYILSLHLSQRRLRWMVECTKAHDFDTKAWASRPLPRTGFRLLSTWLWSGKDCGYGKMFKMSGCPVSFFDLFGCIRMSLLRSMVKGRCGHFLTTELLSEDKRNIYFIKLWKQLGQIVLKMNHNKDAVRAEQQGFLCLLSSKLHTLTCVAEQVFFLPNNLSLGCI